MNVSSRDREREAATVFIVAASDVVRAGLASLINEDGRFSVVGSASGLDESSAQEIKQANPEIVIFNVEQQMGETFDLLRSDLPEVADEDHDDPAFIVIGAEVTEWIRNALQSGIIRALLSHTARGGEILAAIEAVSAGLVTFDLQMMEMLAALATPLLAETEDPPSAQSINTVMNTPPADDSAKFDSLTPREREVLNMLAEGLANKEIAWRLKISEHTVKFHAASIFAKLNVSTRTEAVMQGIRNGLIMM